MKYILEISGGDSDLITNVIQTLITMGYKDIGRYEFTGVSLVELVLYKRWFFFLQAEVTIIPKKKETECTVVFAYDTATDALSLGERLEKDYKYQCPDVIIDTERN